LQTARLSTGANIVGGEGYAAIDADMVDMETFAIARACQRFEVPLMGLRGISDGPGELSGISGWTQLLSLLDERLAEAVDLLAETLSGLRKPLLDAVAFPVGRTSCRSSGSAGQDA